MRSSRVRILFHRRSVSPELTFRPGWDVGIVGMKAGGERELTVPPPMGYGKRKMSGIPPSSTLKFGQYPFHFLRHAVTDTPNSRGQTPLYQLNYKKLPAEMSGTEKYNQFCVLVVPRNIIGRELLSRNTHR